MASATKRVEKKGEKGAFMRLYFPDDKTVAILSTSDIILPEYFNTPDCICQYARERIFVEFFRQEREYVFGSVLCTAETLLFEKKETQKMFPAGKSGTLYHCM